MSFARWGEDGSDLYVYADYSGGVTCCGCLLDDAEDGFGGSVYFYDIDSLFTHYREHRAAGHSVPERLFNREQYRADDFDGAHSTWPRERAI